MLTKNTSETKVVEGKTIEFIPLWVWLILNGKVFFGENNPIKLESAEDISDEGTTV